MTESIESLFIELSKQYPNHRISITYNNEFEVKAFEKNATNILIGLGKTLEEAIENIREKKLP